MKSEKETRAPLESLELLDENFDGEATVEMQMKAVVEEKGDGLSVHG